MTQLTRQSATCWLSKIPIQHPIPALSGKKSCSAATRCSGRAHAIRVMAELTTRPRLPIEKERRSVDAPSPCYAHSLRRQCSHTLAHGLPTQGTRDEKTRSPSRWIRKATKTDHAAMPTTAAELPLLRPPPSRRVPVRACAIEHLKSPPHPRHMAGQRTNWSVQGAKAVLHAATLCGTAHMRTCTTITSDMHRRAGPTDTSSAPPRTPHYKL